MSILSVSQSLSDESRVFNFSTSKTCKIGQLVKTGGELLIFFIVGQKNIDPQNSLYIYISYIYISYIYISYIYIYIIRYRNRSRGNR